MIVLRFAANLLSVVFHPLFILTYILLFLIWVNPYAFGGSDHPQNGLLIINVVILTVILPLIAIVLMRFMNLIDSIKIEKKEDRIAPYISTGVFYLWLSVNAYFTGIFPTVFTVFALGTTIALFMAFVVNIIHKVSLHTVGAGGLVTMIFIIMVWHSYESIETYFLLSILIAGALGTARLLLKAHEPYEVYLGYAIGVLGQLAAFAFFY